MSNNRLTKAIDDLVRKGDEDRKEFGQFRLEVTDKLSAIGNSLAWAKGIAEEFGQFRLEVTDKLSAIGNSLAWAKGIAALIVVPTVLGVAAFSYKAAERAARIEESIVALRDHAKEQDARIAKLIELFEDRSKGKTPAVPPTMNAVPPEKSGRRSGPNETHSQSAHEESLLAAEGDPTGDATDGNGGEVEVPAAATAKGNAARPQ